MPLYGCTDGGSHGLGLAGIFRQVQSSCFPFASPENRRPSAGSPDLAGTVAAGQVLVGGGDSDPSELLLGQGSILNFCSIDGVKRTTRTLPYMVVSWFRLRERPCVVKGSISSGSGKDKGRVEGTRCPNRYPLHC